MRAPLDRLGGLVQPIAQRLDGLRGLVLEGLRVLLLSGTPDQATRIEQPFAQLRLADRLRRLLQLVGALGAVAPGRGGELVQPGQDVAHLFGHGLLGLADPPDLIGRGATHARHRFHAVLHVLLLPGQLVHPLARFLQVALETLVLRSAEIVAGIAQPPQRRPCLGHTGAAPVRRRPAHRVGRLLQLARDLLELPVARLAREPLQLPRGLLRLLGQLPGRVAPAPALSPLLGGGPTLLSLQLLLLAAGELAELLHQLVDLLVGALLLAALHGLVLIAELVRLELEEVGEILGAGSPLTLATAASALLLALQRHEALVRLLGLLELPERALFGTDGATRAQAAQRVHRLVHRIDGDGQALGDVLERLVGSCDAAVDDSLGERLDLLAQPLLRQRHADDVLLPALDAVAVAVAHQVEAGRDDLALQRGEVLLHVATASAAPALGRAALGLAVVAPEGPHLQKVDVGHRLARRRRVVAHDPVVRDQVAHLQLVVLHEDGVTRRDLGEGDAPSRMDGQGVGGPSVHAVDQEDLGDAQIVVGARLDEDLLDRAHLDVAPRPAERDGRPLVVQHVDPVVGSARHPDVVPGQELDAVEAFVAHDERGLERALRPRFHGDGVPRVHDQPGRPGGQGGGHGQRDAGSGQCGHVAAVLEATRREARVAREVVDHLEPVHRGEVGDAEREGAGADAVGLDVVGGLFRDVEKQALPGAGAVLDHGQGRVAVVALRAGVQNDVVGGEAVRDGRDHEVGVARDDRVSRLDRDAVRVDRFGRADREEERRHAVPQEPRAGEEEDDRSEGQAAKHAGGAPHGSPLDASAVVDAPAPPHRPSHHLARELRVREATAPGGLDRRQDARLKRGLVLLQVERDPFVGDGTQKRPEDPPHQEVPDDHPEQDAHSGDGARREAKRLQTRRGDQEGGQHPGHGQSEAPQQQL